MGIKKMITRLFKGTKKNNSEENKSNYSELAKDDCVDEKVTTKLILDSLDTDTFWINDAISVPRDLLGYFVDPEMVHLIDQTVEGFGG